MGHTSLMDVGLISITVLRRVSTNWDMWRSLSLIRTASSSITTLYSCSFIADATETVHKDTTYRVYVSMVTRPHPLTVVEEEGDETVERGQPQVTMVFA